ncbi:MAG: NADPH:quinone oxidoreductase family protein [Alphaproteobacteria bacterium]
MRALICDQYGPPETLRVGELPEPDLTPEGVRIAVQAAALNFADLLAIEGKYQFKSPFPFAPGMECAGEVIEVGTDVTDLKIGDRVAAHPWRHCLAGQVVAPAHLAHKMPEAMDWATGAALTLSYGTSHHALFDRGRLTAGETVLVLGAAGGVGLYAVELAHQAGATVIAAAGGPEKLDLCRRYGADHGIDYRTEDLRARVKELTDGRGVNVVFDAVGGEMAKTALRCVDWGARLLIIGFAGGEIARIPSNHVLIKGTEVIGVAFTPLCEREPAQGKAVIADVMRLWREGRIRPHVSRRLPLDRAVEGMRALGARGTTGKVVIDIAA